MLRQMNPSWLEKVGDSGFSHWLVLPPKICLQLGAWEWTLPWALCSVSGESVTLAEVVCWFGFGTAGCAVLHGHMPIKFHHLLYHY